MSKYKDWDLFENLPDGWRIDKTCGSPLTGYDFCVSGSMLNGGKRALVRVDKSKHKKQDEFISKNEIVPVVAKNETTENVPFPAKTVNILARKKFQEQLLKEIHFDLMVCEIEGWNKKEYIKELQKLLNSIDVSNKKKKSNNINHPSLFDTLT